jgi:hypothetical protein
MASLGDFDTGATLYFKFTTFRPSTGAPFTLAGTPAISVYKDASTTQSTAGVTLTADFDAVTGLNHVAIDTSADGAFYAVGSFFDVVVTTGTVDSVSAVGVVVGRFTLRKTACLKPTTAGRTLDVSAGGEAGVDLANVGSPNHALNLSGTTISTSQQVASVSGAVGSVTGNVGGNVVGSVASVVGTVTANTTQLAGQTVAAASGVTFPSSVASPTNITQATGIVLAATTHTGAVIPWNAAWDAEVESEVQDAIVANHLDHLLAATYDPASKPGVADALMNELVQDNGAGVSQFTTTALELAPAGGGGGTTDWTANERTAIRSILGIPTSGTTPTDPTAGILDTIRDNTVAIEADTVDIQGRLPATLVSGRMDASVGAMAANVLTASALATDAVTEVAGATADAVWDEAYAGHTVAGSFGKLMDTLRKANYVTEGTVAAGGTPTTTSFRTNLTEPDDTFDNQTLLFLTGVLAGEAVPIATTAQTNGLITTQEPLTAAPTAGDEFVILPDHVHPVGEIADAVLDDAVEGAETLRQAIRLVRAALVGKLSGAATTTVTIRDAADSKARITATVDADGNRSAVSTDAT